MNTVTTEVEVHTCVRTAMLINVLEMNRNDQNAQVILLLLAPIILYQNRPKSISLFQLNNTFISIFILIIA